MKLSVDYPASPRSGSHAFHKVKTILICVCDHKDIVHVDCLKQGQIRGSRSVLTVENTWKVTRAVTI
jgi:hypothetical protein